MRLGRPFALLFLVSAALPVLTAQAAVPAPAAAESIKAYDARVLTRAQFDALPDAALIDTRGGRTTAGVLRARSRANAIAQRERIEAVKKTVALQSEAAVQRVQTAQVSALQTTNTRLRADANKAVLMQPLGPVYTGPPEIQTAPATVEPGSYVPLAGRGFGALPGKVVMKGLPTGDRVLTVETWKACWYVPGTGGYSGNGAGYMGFYVIAGPKGVPYK